MRHWSVSGKQLLFALAVLLMAALWENAPTAAADHTQAQNLQTLIDQAQPGSTITVPAGTYAGAIVIDKAVAVKADGVAKITNDGELPAVRIRSDGVRLEGFQIVQQTTDLEQPAVLVTADRVMLNALDIRTNSFGIVLQDADLNEISGSTIARVSRDGNSGGNKAERRNGIDLYNSHGNRIVRNEISDMHDGIYLESSHQTVVAENKIDHSRYGIHCMYTDGTVVRGNKGSFNITGAMVMGVRDAEVADNTFVKQSESVNSQGLLLFDVQTSRIHRNKVAGNRVGLYIEQSHMNELRDNEVAENFIGIQLLESEGNEFISNNFIANVIEAEAIDSKNNSLTGNFWDSFQGIDTDKDGLSDIPYAINPFFQRLTAATPAFQLFFQSPGMLFLEGMFAADKGEWAADLAPLLRPAEQGETVRRESAHTGTMLFSVMLLILSIPILILAGVKRK